MANAAWFSGYRPSTMLPSWSTSSRSDTLIWPKPTPNGLTQKWSVSSGSRAVTWPATPSSKPNSENARYTDASRSLRCRRSASIVSKVGAIGIGISVKGLAVESVVVVTGTIVRRWGGGDRGAALCSSLRRRLVPALARNAGHRGGDFAR